ncbi:MAG: helix-turn-helix transcriptional regulator [Christensenella sp.]|uniref:helix-turn-helix domain-containing protein n=1 Tax=Christensenella sp. TaxID=1935934 RepID=UPI002B1F67AF|nr:helix-turn-helix transcriptional regulator [Christensenella sp.]MEA5002939.1 helix-turn-helix transcriptional regulator [Christensenella sp.]
MYKTKSSDGTNNISGKKIAALRKEMVPKTSQRQFAEMLQLNGMDADKNTVRRIENGERFITDIELKIIAEALKVEVQELLENR